MKHTISVLVENHFGAFDRIATMFSGKGFNLKSISIGETEIPGYFPNDCCYRRR